MIPQAEIIAWRRVAPWADDGMVEQDLVLSRAAVEIFSDATLAAALALRGGTALHKVVLVPPSRYSEDLDLVQVEPEPIGAVLRRLRAQLDPWLGEPTWKQAASTVTLLYRFASEIPPVRRLRAKIEINTREHLALYGHQARPVAVESRWFTGGADVRTFQLDELLATKLRALYQRRRGRDLFDLWDACRRGTVDRTRVIEAAEPRREGAQPHLPRGGDPAAGAGHCLRRPGRAGFRQPRVHRTAPRGGLEGHVAGGLAATRRA